MLNRKHISLWMMMCALGMTWSAFPQCAFALDDWKTTQKVDERDNRPERGIVRGTVWFEKRYTRVPEAMCEGTPCQKSQGYWTLVIYSDEVKYILKEMYAIGSLMAPDSVDIAGVVLRPGSSVQVDALMIRNSPDLFFLLGITSIELLMD